MKFNERFLLESNIEAALNSSIRPSLVQTVMNIIDNNQKSPLVQYILKKITNKIEDKQKFKIRKVEQLESYKLDPKVYELLLHEPVASGIGPGEILISLTAGEWSGGNHGDVDVILDGIGKVEIKYLGHFAYSTNVPFGSANGTSEV